MSLPGRVLPWICFLCLSLAHCTSGFSISPSTCTAAKRYSSQLFARADREEWLEKKQQKEKERTEWERKIQAQKERRRALQPLGKKPQPSKPEIKDLEKKPQEEIASKSNDDDKKDDDGTSCKHFVSKDAITFAQAHSAELIALAGPKFDGNQLGVGGLDDVIDEIKRRVWTPLAAPPSVLKELGISPVRGVLLYGSSGCGKTLLARTIGKLLSPARPLTIVSGPQLMDKFVGSSEKNLRELFDNPSPVYDPYRISGGKGMDDAALHVVVLDEFDSMARTRGGNDNSDTSAAGVARDSVVNQILAKLDGVEPLAVPTLVIAMTNRPNLIDPALLRPGRFEVQIEVPPPRTFSQRVSILGVHMKCMQEAGRLLVRDAPAAGCVSAEKALEATMTYHELIHHLADQCQGLSGASLAAIPRAAASRALERAVTQYSADLNDNIENKGKRDAIAMFDCIVTTEDLDFAVEDVRKSARITTLQSSSSSNLGNSQHEQPGEFQQGETNGVNGDAVPATNGASASLV